MTEAEQERDLKQLVLDRLAKGASEQSEGLLRYFIQLGADMDDFLWREYKEHPSVAELYWRGLLFLRVRIEVGCGEDLGYKIETEVNKPAIDAAIDALLIEMPAQGNA